MYALAFSPSVVVVVVGFSLITWSDFTSLFSFHPTITSRDMLQLDYTIDRNLEQPTLAQMVAKALSLLSKDSPNGFFLLVEGSRIDHAGHDNGHFSLVPFCWRFFCAAMINIASETLTTLTTTTTTTDAATHYREVLAYDDALKVRAPLNQLGVKRS
jgi:hypothetical protein